MTTKRWKATSIDFDHDDVMTIKNFRDCVKNGTFVDDDGHGYLSNGSVYFTELRVCPSNLNDMVLSFPQHNFVVWFNK